MLFLSKIQICYKWNANWSAAMIYLKWNLDTLQIFYTLQRLSAAAYISTWQGNWKWPCTQSSQSHPMLCTCKCIHLRVWVHILGDPESVQLRNTSTTTTTNILQQYNWGMTLKHSMQYIIQSLCKLKIPCLPMYHSIRLKRRPTHWSVIWNTHKYSTQY